MDKARIEQARLVGTRPCVMLLAALAMAAGLAGCSKQRDRFDRVYMHPPEAPHLLKRVTTTR